MPGNATVSKGGAPGTNLIDLRFMEIPFPILPPFFFMFSFSMFSLLQRCQRSQRFSRRHRFLFHRDSFFIFSILFIFHFFILRTSTRSAAKILGEATAAETSTRSAAKILGEAAVRETSTRSAAKILGGAAAVEAKAGAADLGNARSHLKLTTENSLSGHLG